MEADGSIRSTQRMLYCISFVMLLKLKPIPDKGKGQKNQNHYYHEWKSIVLKDKKFSLQRKARQIVQGQSIYM